MRVLGLDPGLATFGWAVVDVADGGATLAAAGAWLLPADAKKRAVGVADDALERAARLAKHLSALLCLYPPRLVAAEAPSYPRNASVAGKIGMAYGALATVLAFTGHPAVWMTPQRVRAVLGARGGKDAVGAAVALLAGGCDGLCALPAGERVHATDAAAVALAARGTPTFNLVAELEVRA